MKPLMVTIFFVFYLNIFISCEISESYDYAEDPTFFEQEQSAVEVVDPVVEDTSSEPDATESDTTESDTTESDPPSSDTSDQVEPEECTTNGGFAGDSGLKTWCWKDIELPDYTGSKGVSFSNKELVIDSECYEQQVTKSGNRLRFRVNPLGPEIGAWCSNNFNMRAEVRTAPWQVRNPLGTEEWFGWRYELGESYVIDQYNQWKFFQIYPGPVGLGAQVSLEVIHKDQFYGHSAGEIYVVNAGGEGSKKYSPTGITPQAGEKLDIVIHVIWEYASKGLLQVWINDQVVYDEQIATVTPEAPWGGNAKWGVYKWPWKVEERIQKSLDQGITYLEAYIGPIRMITRKPGDANFGKDAYATVRPR